MNHYKLISKLKTLKKQSQIGGLDSLQDAVGNVQDRLDAINSLKDKAIALAGNPIQTAGNSNQPPVVRDPQTVGNELPSRTPGSDTALGDTGNGRIPTTEAPLKSPNDPITISKDEYLKSIQNKKPQKSNLYGKSNTNSKSPDPSPTPVEQSLAREYNSKGIYFKSNLSAVNKRDDAGNITLSVGETNGSK